MSVKSALHRYYERQISEIERDQRPRRKNGRPEWKLTQKPCMAWFKENGWAMNAVEARAVYNPSAGRYMAGQTDPGFADAVGCTPDGTAAFVEFKAPGKRHTLRPHQFAFLRARIEKDAFAVCVDSIECLEKIWSEFEHKRKMDKVLARSALLRHLPNQKQYQEKWGIDE